MIFPILLSVSCFFFFLLSFTSGLLILLIFFKELHFALVGPLLFFPVFLISGLIFVFSFYLDFIPWVFFSL